MTTRRSIRYVFIAGPYTTGDPAVNVQLAVRAADALLAAGLLPYVPHLTHLWHLISPKPYRTWIDLDAAWLTRCDALLRLPGESPGADGEEAKAAEMGLPVFYSIEALLKAADGCEAKR